MRNQLIYIKTNRMRSIHAQNLVTFSIYILNAENGVVKIGKL